MEGRNIQRARSIEEGDQIPAAICSSSNIKSGDSRSKNDHDQANNLFETEREDGVARKKLRLSRDQAASLEESFKKHSTLNPVCVRTRCVFSCICFIFASRRSLSKYYLHKACFKS